MFIYSEYRTIETLCKDVTWPKECQLLNRYKEWRSRHPGVGESEFVIESLTTSIDDELKAPGIDFLACFFQLLYPEVESRTIDGIEGEVRIRCVVPPLDIPTAQHLKVNKCHNKTKSSHRSMLYIFIHSRVTPLSDGQIKSASSSI